MEENQYLTAEGAAELRRELEDLLKVKRPRLAQQLKEAIAQGDLSENADYIDAKEQQAFLEGRILYLEKLLRSATIIDDGNNNNTPQEVTVGCEVTILGEDEDEPETYRIVGAAEADPRNGKISNESPIGSALLGRRKGQKVHVAIPAGERIVTIKKITR
ncbi:MAG TPA: transcription elongation factor GreA [Aggregatilinea sp.]|jgi:transcription elongation factor GreA|uniref:transcription elongation factor GreA n=1 Tax=Aggregatilinea sp. TaxID=2806333 RepID=UPI002BADE069|nr:transcription elongation factor GreA [Aggregatilinea sp.]HML20114.1 transcription elongation factor GreA [Aggregatilinea sp.]